MTAAEPLVPAVDPHREKSPLERAAEHLAQTRPLTWFLVNVGNRIDPFLMRVSGGRLNTTGSPIVVVLHHTGAKTGKARQTPLAYFTDGRDIQMIICSPKERVPPRQADWFTYKTTAAAKQTAATTSPMTILRIGALTSQTVATRTKNPARLAAAPELAFCRLADDVVERSMLRRATHVRAGPRLFCGPRDH